MDEKLNLRAEKAIKAYKRILKAFEGLETVGPLEEGITFYLDYRGKLVRGVPSRISYSPLPKLENYKDAERLLKSHKDDLRTFLSAGVY